jgi:alcohol dehydrogenase
LANPLTGLCGVVHGLAVGMMLPHVIRFNSAAGERPYRDLDEDPESLARRVEAMLDAAGLPRTLAQVDVPPAKLPELAKMASTQWTATFNPRPVGEAELLSIYQSAR